MKNKLTRKLMLSAFTLLFAVISLGASTYAWFTMSDKAQINAFDGQVKAGEGIEIAVTSTQNLGNAQWYTGNVPTNVIKAAYEANEFVNFNALSTINNGTKLIDYEGNEADKGTYITFYVHIKTAKPGTVSLSQILLGSAGDSITGWKSDAAYHLPTSDGDEGVEVKVGDQIQYKVEDAARIYVKNEIYEKETNLSSGNNNLAGVKSEYGAYEYYNSKNQDAPLNKTGNNYNEQYDAETLSGTNFYDENDDPNLTSNTSQVLGTTEKTGDIITFEVKIWIEGWDTECLNAIFAQTLKVQLGFSFVLTPENKE